jgi:hypothetical protein
VVGGKRIPGPFAISKKERKLRFNIDPRKLDE